MEPLNGNGELQRIYNYDAAEPPLSPEKIEAIKYALEVNNVSIKEITNNVKISASPVAETAEWDRSSVKPDIASSPLSIKTIDRRRLDVGLDGRTGFGCPG